MPLEGMSLGGGTNIGTLVGHVVADISKWTGNLTKATTQLRTFSTNMDKFLKNNAVSMRRIGMRAALMGGAVAAGVGAMVKSYGEFERRMRRATAVSEVTDKQFVEMSDMKLWHAFLDDFERVEPATHWEDDIEYGVPEWVDDNGWTASDQMGEHRRGGPSLLDDEDYSDNSRNSIDDILLTARYRKRGRFNGT